MSGGAAKARERFIVPVAAAALVVALAGAIWALAMRERSTRRLVLEYEAYKALTALTDLARDATPSKADAEEVIGFALYDADGAPLFVFGDAPASVKQLLFDGDASSRVIGPESVTIVRQLGGDMPGRRMMPGMERGGRMRGLQSPGGSGLNGQASPPSYSGGAALAVPPADSGGPLFAGPAYSRMPAYAYLEYSTGGLKAAETVILVIAGCSTIALGILYGVVVLTYGRYMDARDRESRDRELVELGQAARTIAHEIKNPLGVIRIQCGILRKGADQKMEASLSIIDEEAVRLAEMADRIRRYLRSDEGSPAAMKIRAYIGAFAARYAQSLDIQVSEIGERDSIVVDEARLTEALDNIVANALETGADEKPRLEARVKAGCMELSVLDRGPGVPPEQRHRLFEPFFTTKTKGTGLGLALARKHVEAAGGSIHFSERAGGGSVVSLSMPLA